MKNISILIILLALLFVGCQDDNSILEPTTEFSDSGELNKGRPILGRDFDYLLYDSLGTISNDDISQFGNELIRISDDKYYDGNSDDYTRELDDYVDEDNYHVKYSQNFTINGEKGGRLAIKHQWKNEDGTLVWLKSELKIPSGAFKGVKNFDMIFDIDNLSMELYPSPFSFDRPVEFSMYWYGLDLSQYKGYDFDFNYLDGEKEKIKFYRKSIDIENGNLIVWGAQLHHFSRYGWTRTGS